MKAVGLSAGFGDRAQRPWLWVLASAVVLRCMVFVFLSPCNHDSMGHIEHVASIAETGRMPLSGDWETWQPPLYYAVAAPLWRLWPNARWLQLMSLGLSCATLLVVYVLCFRTSLFDTEGARWCAFLLAGFQSQWVQHSLYVSNDPLAIFIGMVFALAAVRFAEVPSTSRLAGVFAAVTCGLLTKGQFLVVYGATFVLAASAVFRGADAGRWGRRALAFAVGAALLGSVKYAQNALHFGRPFVSNLDFTPYWLAGQQGTVLGAISFLDVNITKLLRWPVLSEHTRHSVPLLFYATQWYQYIPQSSFQGVLRADLQWVGKALYLAAIPLTLAALVGLGRLAGDVVRGFSNSGRVSQLTLRLTMCRGLLVACLVGNVGLLVMVLLKHDAWSIIQARSSYATAAGGLVLLDYAFRSFRALPAWRGAMVSSTVAVCVLSLVYFACEFGDSLGRMGWRSTLRGHTAGCSPGIGRPRLPEYEPDGRRQRVATGQGLPRCRLPTGGEAREKGLSGWRRRATVCQWQPDGVRRCWPRRRKDEYEPIGIRSLRIEQRAGNNLSRCWMRSRQVGLPTQEVCPPPIRTPQRHRSGCLRAACLISQI